MIVREYIEKFPKKVVELSQISNVMTVPYELLSEELTRLIKKGVLYQLSPPASMEDAQSYITATRFLKRKKIMLKILAKIRI